MTAAGRSWLGDGALTGLQGGTRGCWGARGRGAGRGGGGGALRLLGGSGGRAGAKNSGKGSTGVGQEGEDSELAEFCLVECEGAEAGSPGAGAGGGSCGHGAGAGATGRRRRRGPTSGADSSSGSEQEGEGSAGTAAVGLGGRSPWETPLVPGAGKAGVLGGGPGGDGPIKTQVLFCSRTHSQLAQFVGELRRTDLAEKVSVLSLAGRKVLCIHEPVVSGGPPSLINERCSELQQQAHRSKSQAGTRQQQSHKQPRTASAVACPTDDAGARRRRAAPASDASASKCGCPHLAALSKGGPAWEAFVDDTFGFPLDVEELAKAGGARGVCPYYGARRLVAHADLVLLPYASILSREAREALGLDLRGAVVIFDEAHNLVDAVNASHSCSLTATQLRTAQRQLSAYWQRFRGRLGPRNAQQVQLIMRIVAALTAALTGPGTGPTTRGQGQQQDQGLAAGLDRNPVSNPLLPAMAAPAGGTDAPGAPAPVSRVVSANDFVFDCRLESINLLQLLGWAQEAKLLQKVAGYSQTQEVASDNTDAPTSDAGSGDASTRSERLSCLHACTTFLTALTNPDVDGRIVIVPPGSARAAAAGGGGASGGGAGGGELRYVLLNAASQFAKVLADARSVVLASGTLSPIQGVVQQLFPSLPPTSISHYQCGHIVPREALVALVAAKGPAGVPLCLTHQQRGRPEVMDEVGRLLLNLCSAVPDGLVAFVPSFSYLDQLTSRWATTGLLASIEAKKQVFREPRSASSVDAVLQGYAASIAAARSKHSSQGQGPGQGQGQGGASVRCQGPGGALLLSVVGAKLSEGINFGDELGRCVVILGMPYADPTDPELQERMAFLDQQGTSFTGRQYYEDLCMKAVNQCIGRVIRHKDDYAAIVLADSRYLGSSGSSGGGASIAPPGAESAGRATVELAPQPAATSHQQQQRGGRRPVDKLPGWMVPSLVEEVLGFGHVMGRLHQFFRSRRSNQ